MQQLRESNAEYFRRYLNSASGRRRRRRRRVTDVVSVTLILPVITFFRFEGARLLGDGERERETERDRERGLKSRDIFPDGVSSKNLFSAAPSSVTHVDVSRVCTLCTATRIRDGSYVIPLLRNGIGLARRIPTRCSSIMIALPVFSSSWRTGRIMPIFFVYLCVYIHTCVQSIIRC